MTNNKPKNKKVGIELFLCIFTLIILVVILPSYFLIIKGKDSNTTNLSKIDLVTSIINNKFLTTDSSLQEIEEVTEAKIISSYVALGKDGFLREQIDSEEDLLSYEKAQNIYATNVENRILNGITYTVEEKEDGNLSFEIKPYYFSVYALDVNLLAEKLMDLADIERSLMNTDYNAYVIYQYKANIKAMQIIDKHLDYYDNKDETRYFTFYFENDKPAENQYFSLYFNLIGVTSDYMINTDEDKKQQEERINDYLETAIISGVVLKDDPLFL